MTGRIDKPLPLFDTPHFGGKTYDPELDGDRLSTALGKVYRLMSDGRWRTLREISAAVGCSEAGASARLRDLRKKRIAQLYPNGGVERKRQKGAAACKGLWVYRMVL